MKTCPHPRQQKLNFQDLTPFSPVHSFQTLLVDLGTITKNRIQPKLPGAEPFEKITRPTPLQARALSLLGVRL